MFTGTHQMNSIHTLFHFNILISVLITKMKYTHEIQFPSVFPDKILCELSISATFLNYVIMKITSVVNIFACMSLHSCKCVQLDY
jgi:hypothetical protein